MNGNYELEEYLKRNQFLKTETFKKSQALNILIQTKSYE